MKPILLGIVGMGVVIGGSLLIPQTSSVVNTAKEVVVKEKVVEVRPDWAEDEEAVAAARAVVRRKELETERASLVTEIDERQERLDEIDKELGAY